MCLNLLLGALQFTRELFDFSNRENEIELVQRYRRDRRVLLDFILSGSLIKKVVMPPGAVSLDDVDLDQISVDYVLNCAKKGGDFWIEIISSLALVVPHFPLFLIVVGSMLELSEAIRDYHDGTLFPSMVRLDVFIC